MEGSEEEATAGLQEEGGTRSLEPELQDTGGECGRRRIKRYPVGSLGAAGTPEQGSRDWGQTMPDWHS